MKEFKTEISILKLEGKFQLSKFVSRFQIECFEGHLYNDDFLTCDLLFILFYTIYTEIIILIDATTMRLTANFPSTN